MPVETQRAEIKRALAEWEDVANIQFIEVNKRLILSWTQKYRLPLTLSSKWPSMQNKFHYNYSFRAHSFWSSILLAHPHQFHFPFTESFLRNDYITP